MSNFKQYLSAFGKAAEGLSSAIDALHGKKVFIPKYQKFEQNPELARKYIQSVMHKSGLMTPDQKSSYKILTGEGLSMEKDLDTLTQNNPYLFQVIGKGADPNFHLYPPRPPEEVHKEFTEVYKAFSNYEDTLSESTKAGRAYLKDKYLDEAGNLRPEVIRRIKSLHGQDADPYKYVFPADFDKNWVETDADSLLLDKDSWNKNAGLFWPTIEQGDLPQEALSRRLAINFQKPITEEIFEYTPITINRDLEPLYKYLTSIHEGSHKLTRSREHLDEPLSKLYYQSFPTADPSLPGYSSQDKYTKYLLKNTEIRSRLNELRALRELNFNKPFWSNFSDNDVINLKNHPDTHSHLFNLLKLGVGNAELADTFNRSYVTAGIGITGGLAALANMDSESFKKGGKIKTKRRQYGVFKKGGKTSKRKYQNSGKFSGVAVKDFKNTQAGPRTYKERIDNYVQSKTTTPETKQMHIDALKQASIKLKEIDNLSVEEIKNLELQSYLNRKKEIEENIEKWGDEEDIEALKEINQAIEQLSTKVQNPAFIQQWKQTEKGFIEQGAQWDKQKLKEIEQEGPTLKAQAYQEIDKDLIDSYDTQKQRLQDYTESDIYKKRMRKAGMKRQIPTLQKNIKDINYTISGVGPAPVSLNLQVDKGTTHINLPSKTELETLKTPTGEKFEESEPYYAGEEFTHASTMADLNFSNKALKRLLKSYKPSEEASTDYGGFFRKDQQKTLSKLLKKHKLPGQIKTDLNFTSNVQNLPTEDLITVENMPYYMSPTERHAKKTTTTMWMEDQGINPMTDRFSRKEFKRQFRPYITGEKDFNELPHSTQELIKSTKKADKFKHWNRMINKIG